MPMSLQKWLFLHWTSHSCVLSYERRHVFTSYRSPSPDMMTKASHCDRSASLTISRAWFCHSAKQTDKICKACWLMQVCLSCKRNLKRRAASLLLRGGHGWLSCQVWMLGLQMDSTTTCTQSKDWATWYKHICKAVWADSCSSLI